MGFRSNILFLLVVFNFLPLLALYRAVNAWVSTPSRRKIVLAIIGTAILLINIPVSLFWLRSLNIQLNHLPASTLRLIFYPAVAWQTTAVVCTLLLAPAYLMWASYRAARKIAISVKPSPLLDDLPAAPAISRRHFVTGGAGLLVPAIFGTTAVQLYQGLDAVDIPPERAIPMPYLPRSLDGMTVVQLSDLHAGPYIRLKEMEHWVSLANQLHPDLVVLTGDIIDRSLDNLPEALAALHGLRATLGIVAILGNHDITSDRSSPTSDFVGGHTIAQGLESIGIRVLRNQVTTIGSSPDQTQDRLAVIGLDWMVTNGVSTTSGPPTPATGRSFFRYQPAVTREHLSQLAQQIPPETPTLLLAHHPDTFIEVPDFGFGLTLSGHTHGGGQVVFFTWNGAPVGISSAQFKYVSGFFQEKGCSLYVNRGLGYFGIPIRINCPPEISRFRLFRPHTVL